MNQKFQKLLKEKIKQVKAENYQKDEKIISLENEIKKVNNFLFYFFANIFCR